MSPNLLAIDTSAQICSIALAYEGQITCSHHVVERQQASLILPLITQLLAQAGAELKQLQAIAFSAGPGSFTGIRLAASVVQGLAFGLNIPVLPISSLQVLAQGAYLDLQAKNVLVAVNAYGEEIYWGVYQLGQSDLMRAVMDDQRCRPQDIKISMAGPWIGVGDGWALYSNPLHQQVIDIQEVFPSRLPRALEVLSLAQWQFLQGNLLTANQALPIYLYPAEKWRKSS